MDIFEQVAEIKARKATEACNRLFVENLLKDSTLDDEKIASMADVTLEYVKKVKVGLKKK